MVFVPVVILANPFTLFERRDFAMETFQDSIVIAESQRDQRNVC